MKAGELHPWILAKSSLLCHFPARFGSKCWITPSAKPKWKQFYESDIRVEHYCMLKLSTMACNMYASVDMQLQRMQYLWSQSHTPRADLLGCLHCDKIINRLSIHPFSFTCNLALLNCWSALQLINLGKESDYNLKMKWMELSLFHLIKGFT